MVFTNLLKDLYLVKKKKTIYYLNLINQILTEDEAIRRTHRTN